METPFPPVPPLPVWDGFCFGQTPEVPRDSVSQGLLCNDLFYHVSPGLATGRHTFGIVSYGIAISLRPAQEKDVRSRVSRVKAGLSRRTFQKGTLFLMGKKVPARPAEGYVSRNASGCLWVTVLSPSVPFSRPRRIPAHRIPSSKDLCGRSGRHRARKQTAGRRPQESSSTTYRVQFPWG